MENATDNFLDEMNEDNPFLPDDYEVPAGGAYMKFVEGNNSFRTLSRPIIGYVGWTNDNKPMRFKTVEEANKASSELKDGKHKHFWAFVVWNYKTNRVEIMEITQSGIQKNLKALIDNPKWGSPFDYDVVIGRSGSGMDTEYTVQPEPKEVLDEKITLAFNETSVNLEALFTGDDPFEVK